MSIERYRHRIELRVRWAEADMQGVVFNGHYLTYTDVCVTEYWRAIGVPYPSAFAALAVDAFVRKATVEYHRPARYDDQLLVCGRIARIGRSSAGFDVAIFLVDDTAQPLIDAQLVYVCVDGRSNAPVDWPADVRDRIVRFEPTPPEQTASRA